MSPSSPYCKRQASSRCLAWLYSCTGCPAMPQFPEQASTVAPQVDMLALALLGLALLFATVIFIAIVYLGVKYRQGSKARRGVPPTSSLKLEAVWIGVPLVLALGMFTWGASLYFRVETPPADSLEIYVVGK